MTVVEYRPSAAPSQWKQPDHLSDRPAYKSRHLGRVVSTAGVPHLSDEDAKDLHQELTQDIHTLGSRMSSQKWPQDEYRRMRAKKAIWGAVHQALEQKCAAIRKEERRREQLARTFGDLFCDIAREELPQELFTRLLEITKEQHAQASAELARMDAAAT